jgi:tetratricopeptide (TPR) repeat protein
MKNRYQQAREPSQGEIQGLLNLYNAGQLAQAELAAKSLIKSYPGTMLAYNVLGVALEGQRKFEEAAVWYRKALSLNPGLAELHFNLGVVLSNLGKLDDAITSYKRAAALKPNLAVVHFNLGTALQERGRLEEAAAGFHKALTVEPNFFEAHGNLGTVLQKQGKLEGPRRATVAPWRFMPMHAAISTLALRCATRAGWTMQLPVTSRR